MIGPTDAGGSLSGLHLYCQFPDSTTASPVRVRHVSFLRGPERGALLATQLQAPAPWQEIEAEAKELLDRDTKHSEPWPGNWERVWGLTCLWTGFMCKVGLSLHAFFPEVDTALNLVNSEHMHRFQARLTRSKLGCFGAALVVFGQA